MRNLWIALFLMPTLSVQALDWNQPINDEHGKPIPDCQVGAGAEQAKDKCDLVLTIGLLAARALCMPSPTVTDPLKKAAECRLGLRILDDPALVPAADELNMAREAIGRLPSPLAIARGWDILDKAVH